MSYFETISRTGFIVSTITYIVFLLSDVIKPGFVSNYMSVHWWLLAAIVFAGFWSVTLKKTHDHPIIQYIVAGILGIIAAIFTWKIGADLAEFRILVTLIAFVLPMTVLAVLRSGD
ncbi:MAG: hypothetical protein ABIG32_03065 [Candidatus Uhrbacteria bacterium]|nr:hypothetical protein [Patescibacteria group bacterium]MBU1906809.1 hypothetical protein [Patescibacteria group bacterium]